MGLESRLGFTLLVLQISMGPLMAILLGEEEGDKLKCIYVVVVETFQSKTFFTFASSTSPFTVKLHSKANINLYLTLKSAVNSTTQNNAQ